MQAPYAISIWHGSLSDLAAFVNERYMGDNLVTVLPDATSGLNGAVWAVYRVTGDQLNNLRAVPRLTWK